MEGFRFGQFYGMPEREREGVKSDIDTVDTTGTLPGVACFRHLAAHCAAGKYAIDNSISRRNLRECIAARSWRTEVSPSSTEAIDARVDVPGSFAGSGCR
jgi:hypothetical protein